MQNEKLKNNLIFISENLSFIAYTITKLEIKKMSLNDRMQTVKTVIKKLKLVSGRCCKKENSFCYKKKSRLY
jgi:hypothetical protein